MPALTAPTVDALDAAVAVRRREAPSGSGHPLASALAIVGDRWSLAVVAQLANGPQRFNDLATAVRPIARTVLSERLRRLEEAGIVTRKQYSDAPVRWNYRLTVSGTELARVSGVLAHWAARYLGNGEPVLTHDSCGEDVVPAYRCTACGAVPAREVSAAV